MERVREMEKRERLREKIEAERKECEDRGKREKGQGV
jgi:hypothetical protein